MSDGESIKKMLRAVLQSSKDGVSVANLQSEFRSLCGEFIPLKKLGYSKLEDYLRSIPSVVRLDNHMGELTCFATASRETAHIAELVARQRNSKKCGRSQVVNCKMRFKPCNPYMLDVKPRSSLRQPSAAGASNQHASRSGSRGGNRGINVLGDSRQLDKSLSSISPPVDAPAPQPAVKQCMAPDRKEKKLANCRKPTEKPPEKAPRPSQAQPGPDDVELVQSRITQLLEKYCNGLWMSKIPEVYSDMFGQKLHPQVLTQLEKWTSICMVERPTCTNRTDQLVYPPLPPKPFVVRSSGSGSPPPLPTNASKSTTWMSSRPSTLEELVTSLPASPFPKPEVSPQSPLAYPTLIFPPRPVAASSGKLLPSVPLRAPGHGPAPAPQQPPGANHADNAIGVFKDKRKLTVTAHKQNAMPLAPTWTCPASASASAGASSLQPAQDVLPLLKGIPPTSDSESSAATVSAEVRQRLKELLFKCSQGLWAHALPKLFMDTYKMPFPEHVLHNLSLLMDICSVEYPTPSDKRKAILYISSKTDAESTGSQESQQCRSHPLPSGLQILGPVIPPYLVLPSEEYPSVLVTDVKCHAVTVRYVGENYSNAQEAMEDKMCSFYSQGSTHCLSNPVVGQLVAVREDGDEIARAQVTEVMAPNKFKVYYVDHGFSGETSGSNLLELHQDFLCLPFQATNVRLAGLETFSSNPLILSTLEKLSVGKILLMETLEQCQQSEMPVAVLHDTSRDDDDVNINSTCLKVLQDETMNNPLTVNAVYPDVCVTNVCADGIIYCQLPSRGRARLDKLLEKTEAFFVSQMTSESLVYRPFIGKFCLARYKGKWSRVEITNMYSNRVIEILYIDLGIPATVEVTDLRETPPLFLNGLTIIPPQAIKCRLADVKVPEGDWSSEAVVWVKEAVLDSEDCKMKIVKLDEHKGERLVYMYLFTGADGREPDESFNRQLAQSELWQKLTTQSNNAISSSSNRMVLPTGLGDGAGMRTLSSSLPNPVVEASTRPCHGACDVSLPDKTINAGKQLPPLPPPLQLPEPGQNLDVFVPVACHPGYFVLQPWQDLHKLTVLMGEMILYYNQMSNTSTPACVQKGDVCAARIDKNWHRVQVRGILANGLVSVYELDHGKHELVRRDLIRPLIKEFRQLPFLAITAQLAGVKQNQWSEEASVLFRNHVERRALVAQVESVQELSEVRGELWERRLTVYLVNTSLVDRDLWIHNIMANIDTELSSAA